MHDVKLLTILQDADTDELVEKVGEMEMEFEGLRRKLEERNREVVEKNQELWRKTRELGEKTQELGEKTQELQVRMLFKV